MIVVSSWGWPVLLVLLATALMLVEAPRELTLVFFALTVLTTASLEAQRPIGGRLGSPIRRLGEISFGLYMLHSLVGLVIFKVAVPNVDLLKDTPVLAACLALLLTLGLAFSSFHYFEAPSRRWMTAARFGGVPFKMAGGSSNRSGQTVGQSQPVLAR
jgi:peptidoglycan/LPS O-acetylase OafA/YrhL